MIDQNVDLRVKKRCPMIFNKEACYHCLISLITGKIAQQGTRDTQGTKDHTEKNDKVRDSVYQSLQLGILFCFRGINFSTSRKTWSTEMDFRQGFTLSEQLGRLALNTAKQGWHASSDSRQTARELSGAKTSLVSGPKIQTMPALVKDAK